MRQAVAVIFLMVVSSLSGCVTDQAYRKYVSEGTYPPVSESQVEILFRKPDREFVILADLQARGDAVNQFRKVAAGLGADAVIISRLGGYVENSDWANSGKSSSYSRIVGSVIKYK